MRNKTAPISSPISRWFFLVLLMVITLATNVKGASLSTIDVDADSNEALDELYGGTNLKSMDEIAKVSLPKVIPGLWEFLVQRQTPSTSEPANIKVGDVVYYDISEWNPAGVNSMDDGFARCILLGSPNTYKALGSVAGTIYFNSMQRPNYSHFSGAAAAYSDTTDDEHVLTSAEISHTTLTNGGATAAKTYVIDSYIFGADFEFVKTDNHDVTIKPPVGELFYLNGTALDPDDVITNTAANLFKAPIRFRILEHPSNGTFKCLATSTNGDYVDGGLPGAGTDFTQDANCMGAWYLNNNGGNETDRSGEGGTLTQINGTIPTSATVPATYAGTSRDFELADSEELNHADGGSTDISGADQNITVAFWVRPEAIASGAYQFLVSKYDYGSSNRQYAVYLLGTDTDKFKVVGSISPDGAVRVECASTTTDYAVGSWHHIAMVYNDTDIRIYIDGVLHCTPTAHTTGIGDKSSSFAIGCCYQSTVSVHHADGLMDEVIVFDRALTSNEVLALKTDGIDGDNGGND